MESDLLLANLHSANQEKQSLVPILGAGTSISLGLPTWNELIDRLGRLARVEYIDDQTPLTIFNHIEKCKAQLNKDQFNVFIRDNLSIEDRKTTLTHLALSALERNLIITFNLDYAIENAFALLGKPIFPDHVVCNDRLKYYSIDNYKNRQCTTLLKLHGTLKYPSTWVLTKKQYDKHYNLDRKDSVGYWLKEKFLSNFTPLFIGTSLKDPEFYSIRRFREENAFNHGYAIISEREANLNGQMYKELGIITIPFSKPDQIPEVLFEIFDIVPPKGRLSKFATGYEMQLGQISHKLSSDEEEATEFYSIFNNAIDFHPPKVKVNPKSLRDGYHKNWFLDKFNSWLSNKNYDSLRILVGLLVYFPDIMDKVLRKTFLDDKDTYRVLELIYETEDAVSITKIKKYISQSEVFGKLAGMTINAYKDLLSFQAQILGQHPAMEIPPRTSLVEGLKISQFLLTNYQASRILNTKCNSKRIFPYLITSEPIINKDESNDINKDIQVDNNHVKNALRKLVSNLLKNINETSSMGDKSWRIPTATEWISIKNTNETYWPWGDDDPKLGEYAHLTYYNIETGISQNIKKSCIEVGVFRNGSDEFEIFDLIGNVYEVVEADQKYVEDYNEKIDRDFKRSKIQCGDILLAGGSWSTSFQDRTKSDFFEITVPKQYRQSKNIGIRLIQDLDS